ncbi:hypothetical protein Tco_0065901 [Tanacetum coccineum]
MSSPKFAETHNVVAFLEKPEESDGFAEIIDFLKASSVSYALTQSNPVIYTSCIEQFWATAKERTNTDDAEGTDCLPTATIFEELARMGYEKPSQKLTFYKAFFSPQWKYFIHTITQCLSAKSTAWNEFSSSMASLIICLATNQKFNLSKYIFDAMVKHLDGGVKFLMYLRFLQVFINQQLGEDSDHPIDSTQIPIIDQPSLSSQPRKRQPSKKIQRQEAEVPQDEAEHEESVPTPSNDQQPSGIAALKKRIQRLDRRKMSRPTGLKRLRTVGMSRRVESSEDQRVLGALEDAIRYRKTTREEEKIKIARDDKLARDFQAKLDAELLEEQKLARKQEEEANIALY